MYPRLPNTTGRLEMLEVKPMPNVAVALKVEIARITRKELRSEVTGLRMAVRVARAEISTLKGRVQTLEQASQKLTRWHAVPTPAMSTESNGSASRFSARGLMSHRRRLGLSAEDRGTLVGTTGQSILNWESGKTRPRMKYVAALSALRTMGKKEAASRLALLLEHKSAA